MANHEARHSRPTYFIIKDKDILWFIPLNSKVEKYQKFSVILLQNAFPILKKYIVHPHIINGKAIKVIESLKEEILENFNYMISMKKEGINLFFTDIDNLKQIMLEELLVAV